MKKIKYFLYPAVPLVIFIVWTILVKTVDVTYIEDIGFLGFYNFNMAINDMVKTMPNGIFDKITDVILYLSFATIIPFAVLGIVQLVKRKSLLKVDKMLYFMLIGYASAVALYFIFEVVRINYSPLSTPDDLKPSYPSSHIFLALSFLAINLYGAFDYLKLNKGLSLLLIIGVNALMIIQIVFRLFSGKHYITDVVGALLLAAFIFFVVYALDRGFENKEEVEKQE